MLADPKKPIAGRLPGGLDPDMPRAIGDRSSSEPIPLRFERAELLIASLRRIESRAPGRLLPELTTPAVHLPLEPEHNISSLLATSEPVRFERIKLFRPEPSEGTRVGPQEKPSQGMLADARPHWEK
jgi:hypothetical protein